MLHGVLAHVFAVQLWSALRLLATGEFTKQALLWDMGVVHPINIPKPLHPSPAQDGCYASEPCHRKNSIVGNSVLPFYI